MLTHGVSAYAGSAATVNDTIGAEAMPAEIRPLGELPFKMKDLKRPTFPDKTVTVTLADVNTDGKITPAINDMIARLSKSGGGTVVVPEGHWKSGRITLKSNVNLHLENNATIEFSGSIDDYQPAVFTRHEGVEIMGAGTRQ